MSTGLTQTIGKGFSKQLFGHWYPVDQKPTNSDFHNEGCSECVLIAVVIRDENGMIEDRFVEIGYWEKNWMEGKPDDIQLRFAIVPGYQKGVWGKSITAWMPMPPVPINRIKDALVVKSELELAA